jgi:hypothetical protein
MHLLPSRSKRATACCAGAILIFLLAAAPGAAQEAPEPDEDPSARPEVPAGACVSRGYVEVEGIGTASEDFARAAVVAGVSPLQPQVFRRASEQRFIPVCAGVTGVPWRGRLEGSLPPSAHARLLPVRTETYFNSGYPDNRNTGALWGGRGISTSLTAGVEARVGVFSAALAPVVAYQQNRAFEITPVEDSAYSPYRNPWYFTPGVSIDLPQRFGDRAFTRIDPGQSYVRLRIRGVALGASTENLWWGPGARNSILMSNTAPGFPHVHVGTARQVDVGIGRLEAQAVWGHLRESAYFDTIPANDRNLFTGVLTSLEPRGLPGLYLGFGRVYVYDLPPEGLPLGDYFVPLLEPFFKHRLARPGNPSGNRPDNQLISLFARWVLPESGFEVYAEWAREDHSRDLEDFLQEPDHSQGYLLGFQKVVPAGQRWVRLQGELTNLYKHAAPRGARAPTSYYTHGHVPQGYTHRGQILGAGIGPGADSQYLGADLFYRGGRIGVYGERVRRNEAVYYRRIPLVRNDHDVEVTGGVRHVVVLPRIDVDWGAGYSFRWNRDFLDDERNWRINAALTWRPGARATAR